MSDTEKKDAHLQEKLERLSSLQTELGEFADKKEDELTSEDREKISTLTGEFEELEKEVQELKGEKKLSPEEEEEAQRVEREYLERVGLGSYDTIEEAMNDLRDLQGIDADAKRAGFKNVKDAVDALKNRRVDLSKKRDPLTKGTELEKAVAQAVKGSIWNFERLDKMAWKEFKLNHPKVTAKEKDKLFNIAYTQFQDDEDNPYEAAYAYLQTRKRKAGSLPGGGQKAIDILQLKKIVAQAGLPGTGKIPPKPDKEKQQEKKTIWGIGTEEPFIP